MHTIICSKELERDSLNVIACKINELHDLLDAGLPPVAELLVAKQRLTEALMWANHAVNHPRSPQ